ncbi:MAG: protein-disulfide reductase DsbD family protein [Myxococcota bacterium]
MSPCTLLLAWLGSSAALANPYAGSPGLPSGDVPEAQPFQWTVPKLASGEIELALHVPEGFAVYRDYVVVRAAEGPVTLGEPVLPEARLAVDPSNPEEWRALYDHDIVVKVPLKGTGTLVLELEHQGCRKGLCWPITTEKHEVTVVSGG